MSPTAPARPRLDPGWSADPVVGWLVGPGGREVDAKRLVAGLCERLVAAGMPLSRMSYGAPTLHPQISGYQLIWRRGAEAVAEVRYRHGVERSSDYRDSPVKGLYHGAAAVRRRLELPSPRLDFPILRDLADQGATDYVAMPLRFTSGRMGFISWVCDRPGGFGAGELAHLEALLPLISLRLELAASYRMSRSLMETYLGADAARRVLAGQVKRGRGKRIRAAILLSDLRGFTAMADRLPAAQVIVQLNGYFDILATQVHKHAGEVLKFIGDGMLAVFNVDGSSRGTACCQAAHAAIGALKAMAARNRRRRLPMQAGIALHLGDVVYGNIGAANRLDFTVIGAAVNEAARIEGLCRSLDKPILASASFAESCNCLPLLSLGRQSLRGIRQPQEVFTLPLEPPVVGS